MQKHFLIYILLFLVVSATFSAILPYPVFSSYTNINETNATKINNYYETELYQKINTKTEILDLDWKTVNNLLPIDTIFEIIDLKSEISVICTRTGGLNHIDIEPIDNTNSQILSEIATNGWSQTPVPVLVKLNENTFLPGSLTPYPHGYKKTQTSLNGHMCLHFKNSKTDGTEKPDAKHQNNINLATKLGEEFIK